MSSDKEKFYLQENPQDEGRTPEFPSPKRLTLRQIFIRSSIWTGAAAILSFVLMAILGIFAESADALKIACDACFVTGVVFVCLAFLSFSAGQGTFRPLEFAFKSFINMFNRKAERERYHEYSERKKKNARPLPAFLPPIFAGLLFIIAAIILLTIY